MEQASRDRLLAFLARRNEQTAERLEQAVASIEKLRATVDFLVDLLEGRTIVTDSHKRVIERVRAGAQVPPPPPARVRLSVYEDKRAFASNDIDCAARLPLCLGRCCAYAVELSVQDLEEGGVRWDIDDPYMLRHEADGYCTHLDRGTGGCTIYADRPAPCRMYDCRKDPNVWIDFDARIPAPLAEGILAPEAFTRKG
jgi:hypothetical protein